jgi:hypothetical protein
MQRMSVPLEVSVPASGQTSLRLLEEIAHCPVVPDCHRQAGTDHSCRRIVQVQDGVPLAEVQVPEPWSGDLEAAPILFISSNPSISHEEYYPRWGQAGIPSYFTDRFEAGPGRVKNGIYSPLATPRPNGEEHAKNWTRFWAAAKSTARILLGTEPNPGRDYALTEIVHCKSLGEIGVEEASGFCANRYLERTVGHSAASVLIVYGDHAHRYAGRYLLGGEVVTVGTRTGPSTIAGRQRHLVALPHPNSRARGPKRINKVLSRVDLDLASTAVRRQVAAAIGRSVE